MTTRETPVYQLRIYETFEHTQKAFHERFRDHAARIMRKYDFTIIDMWEARSRERTEFVYILRWPDEKSIHEKWTAFMADREWAAIKERTAAEHGSMVVKFRKGACIPFTTQRRIRGPNLEFT